jgi:hypothetical protein
MGQNLEVLVQHSKETKTLSVEDISSRVSVYNYEREETVHLNHIGLEIDII